MNDIKEKTRLTNVTNYNIEIEIGCAIIISELMNRFIVSFTEYSGIDITFRVMMGLQVLFAYVIPVILVIIGFRSPNKFLSFMIPFLSVGVIYPLLDALWLNYIYLVFYPLYIVPKIVTGAILGLIGIGSSYMKESKIISISVIIIGIALLIVSKKNVVNIVYYVITGDISTIGWLLQ